MKLETMRRKYLSLIEELNPGSPELTDDPDIAAKQNEVVNQVMFEVARMKKLPRYVEKPVAEGELLTLEDISKLAGRSVYQINRICGVAYTEKADGTVLKMLQSGTAEIDCYVYPQRITEENASEYEFDLSEDVLEIMPYGIAADLLKSDVSANYGQVYANEFERKLQRLDPRYRMGSFHIEGGVSI